MYYFCGLSRNIFNGSKGFVPTVQYVYFLILNMFVKKIWDNNKKKECKKVFLIQYLKKLIFILTLVFVIIADGEITISQLFSKINEYIHFFLFQMCWHFCHNTNKAALESAVFTTLQSCKFGSLIVKALRIALSQSPVLPDRNYA